MRVALVVLGVWLAGWGSWAVGARTWGAPPEAALVQRLEAAAPPEGVWWGAVVVVKDGEVAIERFYGPQDPRDPESPGIDEFSLFDLGSVSKPLTATAVMRLVHEGKIGLDDAVEKYFPQVTLEAPSGITVRHLLQHTAGRSRASIPPYAEHDVSQTLLSLLGNPATSEPGAAWAYTNVEYCVLAAIAERASGVGFDTYLREQVLKPMGMTRSGVPGEGGKGLALGSATARGFRESDSETALDHPWGWGARGCTGVLTCTADLIAWERALRGATLLPRSVLDQMDGVSGSVATGRAGERFGLGWFISTTDGGATRLSHTGATHGYRAEVRRVPSEGLFIAVLGSDRQNPGAVAQRLEDAALGLSARVFAVRLSLEGLTLSGDKRARLQEPLIARVENEPAVLPGGVHGLVLTIRREAGEIELVRLHLSESMAARLALQLRTALAASDPAALGGEAAKIEVSGRWKPGQRGQLVPSEPVGPDPADQQAGRAPGRPLTLEIIAPATEPDEPPAPSDRPERVPMPRGPGSSGEGADPSVGPIVKSPLPPVVKPTDSATAERRPVLLLVDPSDRSVVVKVVVDDRLGAMLMRGLKSL